MARVTVEDCLEHVNNKFELSTIAAKRARQLARGANARLAWEDDKPTVMALREIAAGEVTIAILDEPDLPPLATGVEPPRPIDPLDDDLDADPISGEVDDEPLDEGEDDLAEGGSPKDNQKDNQNGDKDEDKKQP